MPVEDQALLGPMEDPSGKNWAGQSNQFGLPQGWENMEDPSGRNWAGAGVAPKSFGLTAQTVDINGGPQYLASDAPYSGPPPMSPANLDFSGGTPFPDHWQDYKGNSSTGGGFFTIADLYASQGKGIPHHIMDGANLPSTNNWRLLPQNYRDPSHIMRNGEIISVDPQGAVTERRPGTQPGFNFSGFPEAYLGGFWGWPGQVNIA